jgi:DNA-binding CsgD family transcriptional regulator
MPSSAGAARDLVAAAGSELDPAGVRSSVIAPLQRLMGVGPVFVASADPSTWLFTGATNVEVDSDATQRFFANEFRTTDVVKFSDVAKARVPALSLFGATDGHPETSARWRDILEPLGWGDELRVALRDRGGVWGFLCLHREAADRPFVAGELAALLAVLPDLTAAFRRASLAAAADASGLDGPGVIVLNGGLVAEALTGSASELLAELQEVDPGHALPVPIASIAAQVMETSSPQQLTMRTPAGRWITLHAGLLQGAEEARVAVVIEPPSPAGMLSLFASAVGLTKRETEVVGALLRGESNRLTARRLRVSELTLQTQLRSVFGKAGVHSRGELIARLLAGHHAG